MKTQMNTKTQNNTKKNPKNQTMKMQTNTERQNNGSEAQSD